MTSQPHRYVEEPAGGESGPEVPHSRNDHFHYGKSHVGAGLVEDEQLHSVGTYQRVRRFDVVPQVTSGRIRIVPRGARTFGWIRA